MEINGYRFNRQELAGALGDLGTFLPLAIGLITLNGVNATAVFLTAGLLYIGAGLYYGIPIPVQPLKATSVIAIAMLLVKDILRNPWEIGLAASMGIITLVTGNIAIAFAVGVPVSFLGKLLCQKFILPT